MCGAFAVRAAFVMLAPMTQKIILDTDIGDDIDDALALTIILNSPELELLGVTTVFRDAARRAELARHLLQVWDMSTHVAAGTSRPLLQVFEAQLGTQFQILESETPNETGTDEEHAVDFLLRAARESEATSEKLILVPIGPLTNLAVALAREPELANRVRIVLMGGQWSAPGPEWNIECDPEAAAIVFASGAPIDMIGLDVTLRCKLSAENVSQIENHGTKRCGLLAKLIRLWQFNAEHAPILHDPLAVLTLLGDCVRFEEKRIEVVLCGDERGRTKAVEGEPNARGAVDVDAARAVELFMQRFLA